MEINIAFLLANAVIAEVLLFDNKVLLLLTNIISIDYEERLKISIINIRDFFAKAPTQRDVVVQTLDLKVNTNPDEQNQNDVEEAKQVTVIQNERVTTNALYILSF